MNELQLIKSENFGEIQCDIYTNGSELFMTANQFCECLAEKRKAFDMRLSRNPYLKTNEFSVSNKMRGTDGKMYNTRVFNEDGIYEITMLSESKKAKEFRAWMRKLLKGLRSGTATILPAAELERIKIEAQKERARAMLLNAQNRTIKTLMRTLPEKSLAPIAVEVFGLKVAQDAFGINTGGLLPKCEPNYSATEIGEMLGGITGTKVGTLANQYNLKTDEYGLTVMDKSRYSAKNVPTFRYYKGVVPVLAAIIEQKSA